MYFFGIFIHSSIHPYQKSNTNHTVVVPGCFTNVLRLKIYEGRFVNSSMKEEFTKSVCSMYVYFGMVWLAVVQHYIIRSHPSIHPCTQNRQIQFEKCVNCKKSVDRLNTTFQINARTFYWLFSKPTNKSQRERSTSDFLQSFIAFFRNNE